MAPSKYPSPRAPWGPHGPAPGVKALRRARSGPRGLPQPHPGDSSRVLAWGTGLHPPTPHPNGMHWRRTPPAKIIHKKGVSQPLCPCSHKTVKRGASEVQPQRGRAGDGGRAGDRLGDGPGDWPGAGPGDGPGTSWGTGWGRARDGPRSPFTSTFSLKSSRLASSWFSVFWACSMWLQYSP